MTAILDSFSLAGRVAVVTGAASHLGINISRSLAGLGAKVYLVGRHPEKLEPLRVALEKDGFLGIPTVLDITDEAAAEDFLAALKAEDGRLDVLINSANGTGNAKTFTDKFHGAFDVAVAAVHRFIMASQPLFSGAVAKTGAASIINIASMYGSVSPDFRVYEDSPPSFPYYGAAKAGMLQLTRYLACELAPRSIRVNAISPGPFPSEESRARFPKLIRNLEMKVPLGRLGEPEELEGAVAYLASDASRFVTGINLPVDGGWTAW